MVDGDELDLVESVSLSAGFGVHHKIYVKLRNPKNDRTKYAYQRMILSKYPQVTLLGVHDTLPTGMRAVILDDE